MLRRPDPSAGRPAPPCQIRARHDDRTVTVYQAFSAAIAEPALRAQRFVAPFRRHRMTWIKPSLLWMAYRSGWATKPGQERVLAIDVTRDGFDWALGHACLSHYDPAVHLDREAWATALAAAPVRVQWDPERDVRLQRLDHRTIQVGLGGEAVDRYVDDWVVSITDVTDVLQAIGQHAAGGHVERAQALLPDETPLLIRPPIAAAIGAHP